MLRITSEDGQTAVEYALMLVVVLSVVLALAGIAVAWGDRVAGIADAIASAL
jgi:Flp pilus assembly pilin Flp